MRGWYGGIGWRVWEVMDGGGLSGCDWMVEGGRREDRKQRKEERVLVFGWVLSKIRHLDYTTT